MSSNVLFSNLEEKNLALARASTSIRNLRDSIKSFDFSDVPHSDKSPLFSVTSDPEGYTEQPAVSNRNRRLSNIICKAGKTKFDKNCGKSFATWSSLKQHLRDFHTVIKDDTEEGQYQWPKGSRKPTVPVYGDNEEEAETEMITCYLCNPPKLIPSNRFNVSRHSNLMFHLEFLHSGALWRELWRLCGQTCQHSKHEQVGDTGITYIS